MTTFAAKAKTAEKDSAKSHGAKSQSDNLPDVQSAPLFDFPIQRKAACACAGDCPNCQTKSSNLSISHPGDEYEKEADAVADKVMQMPLHSVGNEKVQLKPISFSQLQRKGVACDDKEKMQRKESGNEGGDMAAPSIVSDVISSSGKSLDKGAQQFMESRMGHDFSNVKVHTDSKAAESAASVNALAYTLGNHIVFNSGQYQPDTEKGKRLLAHELTHSIQQKGNSNNLMRYECPTSSCHGDDGHEGYYERLHPFPPDPVPPVPFPPVPFPPVPVPPIPFPPVPVPPTPVPLVPKEEDLAEEIRNKLFEKVIEARAKGIPNLPSRVPYPYKQDHFWRLNIIISLEPEASIILLLKRYTAEKDSYVQYLFEQIQGKIAEIQKSKGKDAVKDNDGKDQGDEKDCGFFGCIADDIYDFGKDVAGDVAEKVDEIFGFSDLLDLPARIRSLPEFIDLYEQMELFWKFKDHLDEFEKWIKDPQTLLRALMGIEPSGLLDNLESWVYKQDDKSVAVDKGEEIHGLAAKVKNLLAKIRALLKPIFDIRKKMLALVGEMQNLVSKVPSLGSIQYLLSIAGNPDELKEAGEEIIEDIVSEFAGEIAYKIKLKIQEIIQLLELPKIKFKAEDFIKTERIASAIVKAASRLIPGLAGKALRTPPGRLLLSKLTELFLNGTANEAFTVINSKLDVFNHLLAKQFDSTFNTFQSKLVELIVPKIKEKIMGKPVKVSRSPVNDQAVEGNKRLEMLPLMLKESKGEQINNPVLSKMESLIHSDFKDVRIHRDKTAEHAAKMLQANAFTIGQDIYFGKGKYAPDAASGQKLLAHELTHVEQQKQGNRTGTIQRSLMDRLGEGIIDAMSLIPFVPLPETGFKDPKTQKPKRQKDRAELRGKIKKGNLEPDWEDKTIKHGRGWNAHHIIPWEFLDHGVFDVLRANGGWDHNDLKNGIALPTKLGIKGADHLTVHQFPGRLIGKHPVYNGKVKEKLDTLLSLYEKNPARLREEVDKLIEYLKTKELVSSKMAILM